MDFQKLYFRKSRSFGHCALANSIESAEYDRGAAPQAPAGKLWRKNADTAEVKGARSCRTVRGFKRIEVAGGRSTGIRAPTQRSVRIARSRADWSPRDRT